MLYLLSQNGPSPADQKVAKFVYDGDPANKEVRVRAWFFFVCWLLNCRTRSEDSADQGGGRAAQNVPCQEYEGEVTQGETGCFESEAG